MTSSAPERKFSVGDKLTYAHHPDALSTWEVVAVTPQNYVLLGSGSGSLSWEHLWTHPDVERKLTKVIRKPSEEEVWYRLGKFDVIDYVVVRVVTALYVGYELLDEDEIPVPDRMPVRLSIAKHDNFTREYNYQCTAAEAYQRWENGDDVF